MKRFEVTTYELEWHRKVYIIEADSEDEIMSSDDKELVSDDFYDMEKVIIESIHECTNN